jgi:hypothetical protein
VNAPSATNNNAFAGIVVQAYAANAAGQWIEIYESGSICQVYTNQNCTIGENNYITCRCDATLPGVFGAYGLMGKGTARVLQTVDRSSTAGLVLAELMDGEESGLNQVLAPAAAGGALTLSVNGLTSINGTSVNDAHCTATLADGKFYGESKAVNITNTIGNSKNFVWTITSGVSISGTTASALSTLTFNSANEKALLIWYGDKWRLQYLQGVTPA